MCTICFATVQVQQTGGWTTICNVSSCCTRQMGELWLQKMASRVDFAVVEDAHVHHGYTFHELPHCWRAVTEPLDDVQHLLAVQVGAVEQL